MYCAWLAGGKFPEAAQCIAVLHGALLTKDEQRILSWSTDLRLWNAATGEQIGPAMKWCSVYSSMWKISSKADPANLYQFRTGHKARRFRQGRAADQGRA
jgi:hypothetical protein